ncbi:NUDIX hydrolase [Chloroflexota bacterium]
MKVIKREIAFEGKYLRVVNKYCISEEKKEVVWETIERTNVDSRGVVVIIALTKQKELILERQWRAPLESYIIQCPAGLMDVQGESEEDAARRELLEETGYLAKELIPIVTLPLSPMLVDSYGTHFLAPDVEFVGNIEKDPGEEIEVLKVPVREISQFLLNIPKNSELDLRVLGMIWIMEKKGLI